MGELYPGPASGKLLDSAGARHVADGRYGARMAIQRKSTRPVGITNSSGQPEIVLEIDGLTISMTPPGPAVAPAPTDGGEPVPEDGDR
jgi:hypothetical protein